MKKINKIVFTTLIPTYTLLLAIVLLNILRDSIALYKSITMLITVVLSCIINIYVYKKNPANKNYKYISLITTMFTYIVMNLFAENDFMYAIGFTISALYILYFDIKITKITIICFISNNIFYIVGCLMTGMMLSKYELDITSLVIEGCCILVFCFILYLTTSTAIRINNNKLNSIKQAQAQNEDLLNTVIQTVQNIKENVNKGSDIISTLEYANSQTDASFDLVLTSGDTSMKSINTQTELNTSITKLVKEVIRDINIMLEVTTDARNDLVLNTQQMNILESQANEIRANNVEIMRIITSYNDRNNKIKEICLGITDIAKQTNTLAINAAIESARAGDSGKGFSVVAGEIRQLSSQTNDLAKEITSVVSFIEENASDTRTVVSNVVNSISKEHDTINSSINLFEVINENIDNLNINLNQILANANEIDKYNDEINSHTELLRKTSLDNLKDTETSVSINAEYLAQTINTKDVLSKLLESAEQLARYV